MILIRLADLMDMSKDRVSLNIMNLNAEHMDQTTQFHWISHAMVENCEIKARYESTYPSSTPSNDSYLDKRFLAEHIEIHLYLNNKNLTAIKHKKRCQGLDCKIAGETLTVNITDREECSITCNFICKWLAIKNNWLMSELIALKKYLNDNQNNHFTTDISVIVHMKDTNAISQKYLNIVSSYIEQAIELEEGV